MDLSNTNRIVIKVGSSLIAPDGHGCSSRYLLSIAHFIIRCRLQGIQVILVSSGSVAAGRAMFSRNSQKCGNVTLKKAMAAAGQTEMMAAWNKLFDFPTAQLLLTQYDLQQHERYLSIRESIENLLHNGILPIINENDAVTTDVSKVGDNDNLSAMVASSVAADALIICSDVDGLYDSNPRTNKQAKRIRVVKEITTRLMNMASGAGSDVGTGGMKTKLEAANKATRRGIITLIMNGHEETGFNLLLNGENPGTIFFPATRPLDRKKHWLTYGAKAQGELVINDDALAGQSDSDTEFNLDYQDIIDVNGEFTAGDTIVVKNENGDHIAKARAERGSCLLQFLVEQQKHTEQTPHHKMIRPQILNQQEVAILEE